MKRPEVGDNIITFDVQQYHKKCSEFLTFYVSGELSDPYIQMIDELSNKPMEVIGVHETFVEVRGWWKIYDPGIKAVITKETHPEYYL